MGLRPVKSCVVVARLRWISCALCVHDWFGLTRESMYDNYYLILGEACVPVNLAHVGPPNSPQSDFRQFC